MKEKITAYFDKHNWKYIDNGSVLKLDIDGDGLTWSTFFKVDNAESFCCFAVLPSRISGKRADIVTKLLNYINTRIWFGNFELIAEGAEAGQVRFKAGAFLPENCGGEPSDKIIESVLTYSAAAMNTYGRDIIKADLGEGDDIKLFLSE